MQMDSFMPWPPYPPLPDEYEASSQDLWQVQFTTRPTDLVLLSVTQNPTNVKATNVLPFSVSDLLIALPYVFHFPKSR